MSDTVFKFGAGRACTTIEVDPFTPICSKPEVPGSEALTLEVPAPVFTPVVPPQECACFAFASRPGTVNVRMRKRSAITESEPLRKEVSIAVAATGDCCNGAYTVTPTVNIDVPECVTADQVLRSDTVPLGYGGSITYTFGISNCVPYFSMSSVPVSVQLPNIPNLCLGKTSIEVKATYIDADGEEQTATSGSVTVSSSVDTQTGCQKYSFGAINLDLTDLPTGSFGNGGDVDKIGGQLFINGYADNDLPVYVGGGYGDWRTADPNATPDPRAYDEVFSRGPLMRYAAATAGSTDPSTVTSSSVAAYSVPVAVVDTFFAGKTVGGTWDQADYWRSGRTTTGTGNNPDTWDSYGLLDVIWPTGVQWHTDGLSLALPLTEFLYNDSGVLSEAHETKRAVLVSPGPATTKAYNNGSGKQLYAGKNASGLYSRPDGGSGSTEADRVSDGLMVFAGDGLRIYGVLDGSVAANDAGGGAHNAAGYDATRQGAVEIMYGPGFRIREVNDTGGNPQYRNYPVDLPGALALNDGYGIRVFGTDSKTDPSEKTTANTTVGDAAYRVGKLEILYGPGFRIRGASANTYYDKPRDIEGALVPNDGRGLRVHGVTKTTSADTVNDQKNKLEVYGHSGDFLFNYDGKMVLNDQPNASGTAEAEVRLSGGASAAGPYLKDVYKRDRDCTISLLTTWIDSNNAYWSPHTNTAGKGSVYKVDTTLLDQKIDAAEGAIWEHTTSGYNIKAIFGSSANPNTATWQLALACAALLDAVIDIEETISRLAVVRMHFGKAGTLMSADSESSCTASASAGNLARHYAASAS